MEPGAAVKAVYDFETVEDGELPLLAGDIVQVLRKVDRQWLFGVSNDRRGNFPSNFVIELKIPTLQETNELFAALNDFPAQELGDLSFKKGDLIVGTQSIDVNWWKGECNGEKGIFPLTHVWKMDQKVLTKQDLPRKVHLKARVKMNMKAQLRAEMDLFKDDIVNITEEVDKGWYRGECNGHSGIFPASFVAIISDQNETDAGGGSGTNASNLSTENVKSVSELQQADVIANSNSQYGYDCVNSGITAYGRALYSFKAEFKNELTFMKGEIVNLIRHVDEKWTEGEIDGRTGIFPKDFIEIIVDCPNVPSTEKTGNNIDLLAEQPELLEFPTDTYGRILFDFYPQVEGDIQLKEGDTVTLIRKMDQNWLEVITDNGDIGICPFAFIEVIGSGPETLPPSYSEVMKMADYSSNKLLNGFCYDSSGEPVTGVSSSRPVSYPAASNNQFTAGVATIHNNSSTAPTSSVSIDDKIARNLQDLDLSSNFSPSIYAVPHADNRPSFAHGSISESSWNKNTSRPAFRHSQSEQIDNWGGSLKDDFSDVWKKSDLDSSVTTNSSSLANSSLTSLSSNISNNAFTKRNVKTSRITTPQRPPPPTIIWASGSRGHGAPASKSNEAPRKPLRRQTSETGSTASLTDGEQQNNVLQQISEKEERIQKLEAFISKLKNEVESGSNQKDFVSLEITTQIQQFTDEINGLKREVELLRNDLPKPLPRSSVGNKGATIDPGNVSSWPDAKTEQEDQRRSRERRNKMKEQRSCVITEILQTERDYIGDLKILHNTFLTNSEEGRSKGVDISTLFGNLDEVIELANRLLRRLEKTASADSASQMIGECFVDMAEDMKQVYGHYCRNHDDINAILDKYEDKSPGGQYLRHKVELMKRQTNCFDLPSMLIKPVQRILKYPLLLNELVKCTEDDHSDKESLIKAIGLMTDVATAINEFKRRKDLVFKYRKHADTSLSGRISKLSIHSMLKKSSRLGMRLSSTIGLRSVTRDEAFERVEQKFSALEKSIKIFLKDIGAYSEKMDECVSTAMNIAEDIAELYQERKNQQEVDQFRSAHRIIVTQFWEAFKTAIDRTVVTPLQRLLRTYEGPTNLIQKRYDKLLDFEACTNKMEKNKDATKQKTLQENQLLAKQMYEALNSQLLDDLPRLCSTSTDIFRDCIRSFLKARKSFVGKTARHMLSLMELPLMLGSQSGGILETFQVKHTLVVDTLCQLAIVPRHLFPSAKSDTLKKNPSPRNTRLSLGASMQPLSLQTLQNSAERASLLSSYQHSQLYSAYQDYNAADLLDISLKKNDLVGVIKQQDPMGSKLRWFVDKGSVKGFVPAKVLIKYITDSSQLASPQNTSSNTVPLVTLNGNGISNATSISQNSLNFNRNENIRRSLGEDAPVNKPLLQASSATATRSLERDRSRKPLQPSRRAPVPQATVAKQPTENSHFHIPIPSIAEVKEGNESNELPTCYSNRVPSGNNLKNVSMNVIQPVESSRYEEIDDSVYDQGRYEDILDHVSVTNAENKSQNAMSYSNVPLDEFDPYALKGHNKEIYDPVSDYSTANDLYSSHRYEDIVDDVAPTTAADESGQNLEYYYSMYDFSPTGPNQLKLSKGQVLSILHKCDLNRNSDWWFAEDRYQNKGYVPGNYLAKYSDIAGYF